MSDIGNEGKAKPIKNDLNAFENHTVLRGVPGRGIGRGRKEAKKG